MPPKEKPSGFPPPPTLFAAVASPGRRKLASFVFVLFFFLALGAQSLAGLDSELLKSLATYGLYGFAVYNGANTAKAWSPKNLLSGSGDPPPSPAAVGKPLPAAPSADSVKL